MRAGVYYMPSTDKVVILSNVQIYEGTFSEKTNEWNPNKIAICNWHDVNGFHKKVLLKQEQFKLFKRIGAL